MNNCCLIGGGGFIGMSVAALLSSEGRDVTILDTRPAPSHFPKVARYCMGDYLDKERLRKALEGASSVINLSYATVPSTSIEDPIQDILSNLPAAVRLFETVEDYAIQKIVVVSSGGTVYGSPQGLPLTEDHPTNPISPYGVTKLAIEKYGHLFHRLKGLPIVTVRPANAYGEYQNPFVGQGFIAAAITAILRQEPITLFGAQGTIRDYVHVEDIARGIVAALDGGRPGTVYNIGSGEGRSNKQVLDEICPYAEALGYQLTIDTLPARRFDVEANVLDSTRLRTDTGWNVHISFPAGLKRTWEWFVKNHQSRRRLRGAAR